jgi:hypothetical protein
MARVDVDVLSLVIVSNGNLIVTGIIVSMFADLILFYQRG